MLKGINVILYERTATGKDAFNKTTYEENPVVVSNVIVSPVSAEDNISNLSLYGKKAVYLLCLPKGDNHEWEDCKVELFGQTFRTFGFAEELIEEMVPLSWNKKIKVERYG